MGSAQHLWFAKKLWIYQLFEQGYAFVWGGAADTYPQPFFDQLGSMIPNPSELLGSLQMKRFLDEARRKSIRHF